MQDLAERLARAADDAGVPLERMHRLHLLEGVLRRWARSASAGDLVLGGSLLTRGWVGPSRRTANDLDFVGLYPHDVEGTVARFGAALAGDLGDGVEYDLDSLTGEGTWGDTTLPGVRLDFTGRLLGRNDELKLDVGFGYPLTPPARPMDYACAAGPTVRVQALRPEWMVAWKLNGLFFLGRGRWLPKGLFDLHLLTAHVALDEELLLEGISTAFERTAIPLERILTVLYRRFFWEKAGSQHRWESFREGCTYPTPESLLDMAAGVARRLRPTLGRLIEFPAEGVWPGDE
jgi:hypothetical protein